MTSLFAELFGGGGGGTEFSSDSGSSGTNGTGKDIVIDYGNTGHSHSYSHSFENDDDDDDYDGYEEEEGEEEDDEEEHHIIKIMKEDAYFKTFDLVDFLYLHRERIIYCYNQFEQHSPLSLPGTAEFTEDELQGMEYLMDPRRLPSTTTKKEFPQIFLSPEKIYSKPIEGLVDTFLVPSSFDYVFSYIIEMALLDCGSPRLPDFVWKERNYQRVERIKLQSRSACHRKEVDHTKCPFQWVLYTKSNGEFMKYCTNVQSRNKYIDYTHNEQFLSIFPLSFYLVHFLCGGGERMKTTEDSEFWVSVPIHYLDIWESGHTTVI